MLFFKKKPKAVKIFYSLNEKGNASKTYCPFGVRIMENSDLDVSIRHIGTNGCYQCSFNKEKDKWVIPEYNINFDFKMGYVQCTHPLNEGEKKLLEQIERITLQFIKPTKKGKKNMDEKTLEQIRFQLDENIFDKNKVEDIIEKEEQPKEKEAKKE